MNVAVICVELTTLTPLTVMRQRQELRQLEAIEELVQLRRWQQAAVPRVTIPPPDLKAYDRLLIVATRAEIPP